MQFVFAHRDAFHPDIASYSEHIKLYQQTSFQASSTERSELARERLSHHQKQNHGIREHETTAIWRNNLKLAAQGCKSDIQLARLRERARKTTQTDVQGPSERALETSREPPGYDG